MPYQQHHVAPYTAAGFPSEFGNIFENMAKGYGYANLPKDIMLRQEGERLKNALSTEELKYAPQMNSARLGLMGEQIKQLRMDTDPNAYLNYVNALMNGMNSGQNQAATSFSNNNADLVSSGKAQIPSFKGVPQQYVDPNEIPPEYRGSQADNQMLQQALQTPNRAQQQGLSLPDMLIRKKLGLPMQTPQELAEQQYNLKIAEHQSIEDAKERRAFEQESPIVRERLNNVKRAIQLANQHPEYFTPVTGRVGEKFQRAFNNEKDFGELQMLLAELVAPFAQELSHKGLASALNYAMVTKPGLTENPNSAIGKLDRIKKKMENELGYKSLRYQNIGGTSKNDNDPLGIR